MIAPQGHGMPRSAGGPSTDRRLWYLIAATRGGVNRARILWTLHDRPFNANDLASHLRLDYKTVRHHLDILRENDCVMTLGNEGYGLLYSLSPHLQTHFDEFEVIWRRMEARAELGKLQNTHPPVEAVQG